MCATHTGKVDTHSRQISGVADRLAAVRTRVREGVRRALAQDNTPNEIAVSFALASLYAALPTAGTAIVLFLAVAALTDRVSRVALLAALVVYNPAVKWAVYAVSYPVGAAVLGPVAGVSPSDVSASISFATAESVLVRQLLGNAVLAVVLALLGYAVVLVVARWYREHETDDATPARPADA